MQLKTGFYFISTIVTSPWGEHWVQRDSVEDKSFVPKPVNVQVDEAGAAEWYIEQIGDTSVFKLSAGSINADPAPTVDQDGKLVADISGVSSTSWTVTECGETCDEGVFIITNDEGNAWQTPQTNDTDPQILLQYLVIPLIYPPKYPTYAQFKFASVDDVD
ncbi:hypothetical protein INS49_014106 [Diaporthe citri]|uniref:uncharacterized protein n=1 Tax=Diaporthe citri TaxID=83186 RepID=UPI001C7E47BE|nr:uncharacterized protein INS49_014106 [Diaporthe citri]KAG6358222.1 hypothetical protein INS49_014106 [Diaporthe citri]